MTGTERTLLAFACEKLTLTDALSSPADWRPDRAIVTGIVDPEELPLLPLPLELCATGLTAVIRPLTVLPAGISTVTGSPTLASDCLLASRSTVTVRCLELV